jgi:transposase
MNERNVTLTVREQKRLKVIAEVDAGRMIGKEAAEMLGLSLRQTRRLLAAYRKEGAAGLSHGNRGRPSPRRIREEVCHEIVRLVRAQYKDYNDCHFTEKLAEKHGIEVSRSTVRRLRRSVGEGSPRKRRAPRHRSRRERYPQPGMLLQLDGSPHDWLEGRGPQLVLIAAIDDATNEIPFALFREVEDAAGYFELIQTISQSHGLPLAVYADRHTIFQSPAKATPEQEIAGQRRRSQFGRLMDELAIELIEARSPQAKGRVERLFGTFQDRLVKELREAGATNRAEADQVLWGYLPRFNARFSVAQAEPGSAYRPWPAELDPQRHFCFKHRRTVNGDNTISFSGHALPIPPDRQRGSYRRARVDVHQWLDGSLAIDYQGRTLATFQPASDEPVRVGKFTPAPFAKPDPPARPALPPTPEPTRPRQVRHQPALNHPWRRYPTPTRSG